MPKVRAEELADMVEDRGGVTLKGIDAYVVEAENDVECSAFEGRYNMVLGTFTVLTFNDSFGEENYILLNPECEVEVLS